MASPTSRSGDSFLGTILVTGGAGYIGSHAARALAKAGRGVVVYDNLIAGHRRAVGDATLVEGDIRDSALVRDTIRKHDVTAVMHFAALLSVGDSVRDPLGYYQNNVEGALSVLGAMAAESVRHFIFSSTAAVYGEPQEVPITEAHPTRPINAYGQTKLAVEQALPHIERAYGIHAVCLRYFNAAGADPDGALGEDHHPEQHLIPRAIDAATGADALQVFGNDYPTPDGTCLRDYIHVTDLADAHLLALSMLEETATSATYNLGNGRPFSVTEVIEAVQAVTGRKVPWHLAPRRAGDPAVLYASSDKIKTELKWRPRFPALHAIVATAWRWRAAHPRGYEDR
jgi:UDP-glucose-4-epimerase GalE